MNSTHPRRSLKVLHVAQTAQGGVGSYLEEIMPLQAQAYGADCVRAVLPAEHAAAFPGLLPQWLVTFAAPQGGRWLSTWRMTLRAIDTVRRWQPDVVHLHSTFAGLALRPILALFGGPLVIYCAHGWSFDRQAGRSQIRLFQAMERLLSRLCDRVVCVSRKDHERGSNAGIPPRTMRVILNGIADHPLPAASLPANPWPPTGLKVLFVGRLDEQKGVDVLFSAMRELGTGAYAVVVGSSVVAGEAVANLPGNVKVLGWLPRDEIEQLYAAADVLAMPSRWEGLPIVAIEAMRAGLPVVATRVGGIPEAVEDGVTGRLVDVDSPSQLAAALGGLDRATLRLMGAQGRRRFEEQFRIERVVRELDALYRECAPVVLQRANACQKG
ncbi:MAG TPA: glycosyltransferase family 4 protein [Ramlibacter sp.]|nr:glycosyltransferase family 4 protein [Ramlibacter sp.]